jgi:hypothetical protein
MLVVGGIKPIKIMKILCENNQFIELKVLGYEFPENISDEWDSNWLIIYINVKTIEKHWNTACPVLTTFELKGLINWLENISKDKIDNYKSIFFTEPNLSFELLNDINSEIKEIKINFGAEFNPFSAMNSNKECFIIFKANNKEIKIYVEELRDELNKYPERKISAK